MENGELHKLLQAATKGDAAALERLRRLVAYGECIEKAFLERSPGRRALRLVVPRGEDKRTTEPNPPNSKGKGRKP